MVGRLDDGLAFEQSYLEFVSYFINATGEFRHTAENS